MDIYKLLQQDIQSKIKKSKLCGSDCNMLSEQIYAETERRISSSTLKRFFKLIKSNFKLSQYTLDTLTIYLGFKDWKDYMQCYDDSRLINSDIDAWDLLKKRMMIVTENSLDSLKQKTNYKPHKFIFRNFVKNRFENFEKSGKSATIFVGPDGYGKSTLMIQLVENYYLNKDTRFYNDIVCLIDGKIFFNLYSRNTNIDLLNQLIDFKIHSSLNFYFQRNPEKRKGRIWLLVDNIDEVFFDKESYHQLIENIMRIIMVNDSSWFKVIITCRPENLQIFTHVIKKNPLLKAFWYDVAFFEKKYIDAVNIPLFSKKEIQQILNLRAVNTQLNDVLNINNDLLEIISHPYTFALFIHESKKNEDISEVTLLNRYVQNKILSPPFLDEKLQLINRFMALCDRGKKGTSVEKDLLVTGSNVLLAYQQLISDGIIYEYTKKSDSIDIRIYVHFNQDVIFNYMVLRIWRKDKLFDSKLFFEIMEFYCGRKHMQCSLLKLIIKMLAHKKDFELIKEIYDLVTKLLLPDKKLSSVPDCMIALASAMKAVLENEMELHNIFRI